MDTITTQQKDDVHTDIIDIIDHSVYVNIYLDSFEHITEIESIIKNESKLESFVRETLVKNSKFIATYHFDKLSEKEQEDMIQTTILKIKKNKFIYSFVGCSYNLTKISNYF